MNTRLLIIFSIIFLSACVQGEPEISKRQMRQINKLVEYKLDSFKKAEQTVCYNEVVTLARIKADSVISIFETEAKIDTLNRPEKPIKPAKPEVTIPEFED